MSWWQRTPVVVSAIWAALIAILALFGMAISTDRHNEDRSDQIVELCADVGGTESRQACVDTWHEEFFG